ncbi:MAG: urease accessory protein UreF [Proteobacteria bacterium]|nr:urease accessory protein UreF [Pseudomonadota bacterium]
MAYRIITPMIEEPADSARQQLLLLTWFSPAFPIGGFAFSHGLEWAQECGAVEERAALKQWLLDLAEHGSARSDAILLAEAWRRRRDEDIAALIDFAAALQPSRERYLEATVQGQAFMKMVSAVYGALPQSLQEFDRITLPVAVGLCGAAHGAALVPLLTGYLGGFIANLCSAAVRLGIVGQTDGQRVIAALHPAVMRLAAEAAHLTLDDLGSAALRSDLFSLQHETQYSRLFRS